MSLQNTPSANRVHIGIFGKVNSGKSTLLNQLTKQEVAVVSNEKGTTTDPVYKAMELHGIGPVTFIDTAGFKDDTILGKKRIEKTKQVAKKVDIAIVLFIDTDSNEGIEWIQYFKEQNTLVIPIINKTLHTNVEAISSILYKQGIKDSIVADILDSKDVEKIKEIIMQRAILEEEISITGNLVKQGDIVMLVMPQDIQAPKGRLILPQVQTIRELLDKVCIVVSCTTEMIDQTLISLVKAPDLIICDSQVFKVVYDKKPKESKLTSFSVLFAGYKGDIQAFKKGANSIASLTKESKVLIAEACTHAPLNEDIGTVKIPRLLRKKIGEELTIDMVNGADFPKDLSTYDLIIHCGACMFNRKHVLSRIKEAKKQNVPITNYGITLAYLNGILNKINI